VTLTSSAPNLQSVVTGDSVTFTATVANFNPIGSNEQVTFKDGSTIIATVPLDLSTGQASFTTTFPLAGLTNPWAGHFISATYTGDSPTGTAELVQSVHESATTTTVTSSPNPSTLGEAVTFTATVTPVVSGLGPPTGLVTFYEGTTVLGASGLDSTGVAT